MKKLTLVVDMYGCPNRCKHCWLGHMPNRSMAENTDELLVSYFKPYFDGITYYSWVREPDFCDDYHRRWIRDNEISIQIKPERFELASFYRLVRDEGYVEFLKETGVKKVQLTFFGLEETTDYFVGRKNAYRELLQATDILISNGISPRWQAFLYETNKDELVKLLEVIENRDLYRRCAAFGGEFEFFVHAGSCDGENLKQYPNRIQKENIPEKLISCFLGYDEILEERECIAMLSESHEPIVFDPSDDIVLNVSNQMDVYYNYTHMTKPWVIGNVLTEEPAELARKITEGDTFALNALRNCSYSELAKRYGDTGSTKVFELDDYKMYLVNLYLNDCTAI